MADPASEAASRACGAVPVAPCASRFASVRDHLLRAAAAASRVTTAAGPNESDKAVERLGSLEEELSLQQRDASRWLEQQVEAVWATEADANRNCRRH